MKTIYIQTSPYFEKLGVKEDGRVVKLIGSEKNSSSIIGNIYRAKITKVVKSISGYFVDIGTDEEVFMRMNKNKSYSPGEYLYVQGVTDVDKEKRARVTDDISIGGKYSVFLPGKDKIKFSNKIKDEDLKKSIRDSLKSFGIEDSVLVRTEAKDANIELITKELEELKKEFTDLCSSINISKVGIIRRTDEIRDYLIKNINLEDDVLITNEKRYYELVRDLMRKTKVFNYDNIILEEYDIFGAEGLTQEIESCRRGSFYLSNGSNLLFEKTAAMWTVDINSASNMRGSMETTAYNSNIGVVDEIVHRIKLLGLKGIIAIDFISMKNKKNISSLENIMKKKLYKEDHNRIELTEINSLGVMMMARQNREKTFDDMFLKEQKATGEGYRVYKEAYTEDLKYHEKK